MYSLHDVEVTGLNLKEILKCEIESRIGEHAQLRLCALAAQENFIFEVSNYQEIEVFVREKNGRKRLFSGVLTDIQITENGQVKTVSIEGKSRSFLMDCTKRSRSFQNGAMSLEQLVRSVLKDYKKSDFQYIGPAKKIQSLFVQYDETDWEFLQRVLSLSGMMLTPDCRQSGLKLYAGVPQLLNTSVSYRIVGMEKDMKQYYDQKANGRQAGVSDFISYRVKSGQTAGIFETLSIKGTSFVICEFQYSFEKEQLCAVYKVQKTKGLVRNALYPMNLIGMAFDAKVVKVSGTKILAAMAIDGSSAQAAQYWFPYSTISASSDGSGWYCMPEIGDDVRIYFPSKKESEAIALSSVSSYDAPKSGEDFMGDPNSRYLRTKSGQQLTLASNNMKLSSKGASAVTIQNNGTVQIHANSMVKASAQQISLEAKDTMTIHVLEQFALTSFNGGKISSSEGNVILQGTQVNMD